MNATDPNLPLLEMVVHSFGPLCERFVFIGGCAAGLLVTESAAPPIRATQDVDVLVEIFSLVEYHALERELQNRGFKHDQSPDAPVCRWVVGRALVDVMATDERVLGFGNRWYSEAVRTAEPIYLPSGRKILLIAPPVFLGTKLEAFHDRGRGDFLASHDLEDIVTVIDGRPTLPDEVEVAAPALRTYLADQFAAMLSNPGFVEALPAHLPGDPASQARLPMIKERLIRLAASTG